MPDADLEAIWRERLQAAQETYSAASARCCAIQAKSGAQAPSPDGSVTLQQALRAENAARTEYMKVLDIFTRLLVHGEIPGDNEGA